LAAVEISDAQLVERFVDAADEAAFTALVHRHGRMVLGVCRRVLGAGPDLEDVFQATFVVLARKVRTIRKRESVASWLHGVAYHLATKVRSQRTRRRQREITTDNALDQIEEAQTMHVDPSVRASLRELGSILDEELQRLPAGCRVAAILCLIEGLSHSEAAQQLGLPLGTLKARIQRGRTLLRQRLERRGVALSAGVLSVVLTEQATAAVSATLIRATVQGAAHNAVSARVAALADMGARVLAAWKLNLAVLATLAISLAGFAAAAVSFGGKDADGPADRPVVAEGKPRDLPDAPLPKGAVARLGTPRWRHGGPVNFVEFLPDKQTVVSAADDRFVRVCRRQRIAPLWAGTPSGGNAGSR
jgi:RNA polymerase sigma factor (sigma-70 family)